MVVKACRNFLTSSSAFTIFSFSCSCESDNYFLIAAYLSPIFLFYVQRATTIFLRYYSQNCSTTCSYFSFLRVQIREVKLLHIANKSSSDYSPSPDVAFSADFYYLFFDLDLSSSGASTFLSYLFKIYSCIYAGTSSLLYLGLFSYLSSANDSTPALARLSSCTFIIICKNSNGIVLIGRILGNMKQLIKKAPISSRSDGCHGHAISCCGYCFGMAPASVVRRMNL